MKIYRRSLLLVILILSAGMVFLATGCGQAKKPPAVTSEKVGYHCPMHPTYTSDKPGDCPICGMRLVKDEKAPPLAAVNSTSPAPSLSKEKTLKEICLLHKCTMKNCPMMIKVNLRPGERLVCPICGEVIGTENGQVVEVANDKTPSSPGVSVGTPERKLLYYRNPMNPEVTSPVPMKDSMGMDYVAVYEPESPTTTKSGSAITISPEQQQLIGLKTASVQVMDLAKVVRASGKIAYDPELAVTQEEFIQTLNTADELKDSPLKDVVDRAQNLTAAARNKLKLSGMSDEEISVLEKTRQADTNMYLPKAGESVWAYISIYEYEIGLIKVKDSVELEAVAYPGEKFSGEVVSINPVLDPNTRTNQLRVKVPNPDNKLKPEMFVNAIIKESLGQKLAVPVTAILDTGLRKIVYLALENNVLESREVTLGQKAEGYYEVLGGLQEGDVVVTSGNFLVDSESKLKSP